MTVINSLITHLLISLRKVKNEYPGMGDCYVFGSALTQNTPSDIDILLVYDHDKTDLTMISLLKTRLCQVVEEDLGKRVDLCALSKPEVVQSNFVVDENCRFLFSL